MCLLASWSCSNWLPLCVLESGREKSFITCALQYLCFVAPAAMNL